MADSYVSAFRLFVTMIAQRYLKTRRSIVHTLMKTYALLTCCVLLSAPLTAQTAEQQEKAIEQKVKTIDLQVDAMDKHNCADCLMLLGKDTVVTPVSTIYPDLTAHWHDGKPERITAVYTSEAGKKWEAACYYAEDSLIYVYSEYATELTTMGPGFYVVDFSVEHYYTQGKPFYKRSAGAGKGLPAAYVDPIALQQMAIEWYALAKKRKP